MNPTVKLIERPENDLVAMVDYIAGPRVVAVAWYRPKSHTYRIYDIVAGGPGRPATKETVRERLLAVAKQHA